MTTIEDWLPIENRYTALHTSLPRQTSPPYSLNFNRSNMKINICLRQLSPKVIVCFAPLNVNLKFFIHFLLRLDVSSGSRSRSPPCQGF